MQCQVAAVRVCADYRGVCVQPRVRLRPLHVRGPDRLLSSSLQGGTRSPSSIELIAVERVIVERPSRLRAAASTLARLLRLPASWQGAGADGGRVSAGALLDALTAAGSSEAGGVVGMPAAVTSAAAAAAEGQRAALPAGEDDEGDEQRLPMTAFDDEYLDDVDSMEQPGRRLMLEAREVGPA